MLIASNTLCGSLPQRDAFARAKHPNVNSKQEASGLCRVKAKVVQNKWKLHLPFMNHKLMVQLLDSHSSSCDSVPTIEVFIHFLSVSFQATRENHKH
jgi:hypothetical protein